MQHSVLPLPSINSHESSHHVLKWPDARMDSVGSNDMQQSDMNHPAHTHKRMHTRCGATHSQRSQRHNLWKKQNKREPLQNAARQSRHC